MRQGFSYLERIADKACPVLDTGCVRLSTKDARQNNNLEPLSDSKGTRNALAKAILLFLFSFTPAFGAATPHLLTPNDAKSGTLMLETQIEGQYIEAPALMTDVMMTISGPLARVKVTQRFENTSAAWVEGVYVFPLPEKSAVDTLRMQIGDRFIEGRIEEKQKAKAIYEAAKEAGHKASLLEQNRPNLFTNHAANIGPGETLIVQIEYQEIVKLDAGQFSLRFPMVAAPRYTPAPLFMTASLDGESGWGSDNRDLISPPILHPDMGEVNPVQITVDLHAGFALGEINSAYHPMAVDHQTPEKATLTLKDGPTPANRDFVLHWKPKASEAPSLALFKEEVEGVPYYLLMLSPPAGAEPPSRAREVTFVIDTSGSMAGASIRQAQKSLSMAIQRLNPDDHFNLIEFNSRTHALFQHPLPARPSSISAAISWL
ncbi:MAG: VIT domain-containing protein [Pseudomonadota bacterium]